MLDIFLSLPGSSRGRYRRLPPVLDGLQAYAFPPLSVIPRVLAKLREISRNGAHTSGSVLAPEAMVSGPPPSIAGTSSGSSGAPQTYCTCRSLGSFTRVSTGFAFMPGDSPALHESGRVLFYSSLPGLLGASPILAQGLPTQVAGVPLLVPLLRSLGVSPFCS